jgi:hypothetical protein
MTSISSVSNKKATQVRVVRISPAVLMEMIQNKMVPSLIPAKITLNEDGSRFLTTAN